MRPTILSLTMRGIWKNEAKVPVEVSSTGTPVMFSSIKVGSDSLRRAERELVMLCLS